MFDAMTTQINDNWLRVQERIANAAARSHRNLQDITW